MSNGQLIQPGQVKIGVQMQDGPNAQPVSISIPQPGAMQVMVFGGLTKLEAVAAQVVHYCEEFAPEEAAERALDLAELILAGAAKRQSPT